MQKRYIFYDRHRYDTKVNSLALHIYPIEVLHTRYVTKRDLQRENFFFYKDRSEIIKKYFTI